ncbi:putative signal peptide protein [Ralstonia pseudosolanacearum GMI1000]|uniref:Signal peptide protein n=1 Tax=Ralstonia nicotianae (strain ATCC BAA-1114 / GMI1000) TaxID=267608 RepID=Q8XXP5_RALN1|nr:putative signal peptide protein [Ralstonia pseudosolanacearum GMI1000]
MRVTNKCLRQHADAGILFFAAAFAAVPGNRQAMAAG